MKNSHNIYKTNLSLLTDLYQLTMAYGYWKTGIYNREAVFHLYFRRNPFGGQYTIASGLAPAIDYVQNLHFSEEDVAYLRTLKGVDEQRLLDDDFLDFLKDFCFECDIDAVTEGSFVFPNEPMMRVKGPLWQANLIETTLLNIINFSSLITTKASRIVKAAQGDMVLEFGLRRAQGFDGGLTASRAAYIGGCYATSNVAAGQLYNIPVKGTHAHSWVMSWPNEMTAFEKMAEAMPHNAAFLVDTYNTIEGVKNVIQLSKNPDFQHVKIQSIRLDSGDLAPLSIEARRLLDEAGLTEVKIVASNDLDEYAIEKLKKEGAKIDIWGIGTKLVTAFDQPVLGGVYKLGAIKNEQGEWAYKMKFSEEAVKASTPGFLQVRRVIEVSDNGNRIENIQDIIYDELDVDTLPEGENLLTPIFQNGALVYQTPDIQSIRNKSIENMKLFDEKILKSFRVSLDKKLILRKEKLQAALKEDLKEIPSIS